MTQVKRATPPPPAHHCPVCRHPQTKLQRRLSATTNGSTIFVCTRVGECSIGVNLSRVDTWVAV
jgi:hypothetical protein